MDQHNVKDIMTAHGFNYWSEVQKVLYMINGIKTHLVDTFIANISGSSVLRDDFDAAACHVADFIVIMKSREPHINQNISGVDTEQGGGGGRGCGGGLGLGRGGQGGGGRISRGRRGIPPQYAVGACTHITKSYYPADQYIRFTPEDNKKVW